MLLPSLRGLWQRMRETLGALERWRCITAFFSSAFLAFGLYHVHSFSGITEGGVLGASLSYIPLRRIAYSVLTVLISGQLIGLIQKLRLPWERAETDSNSA